MSLHDDIRNEFPVFLSLVEGMSKQMHKKLSIRYTDSGQTYNNGKDITFNGQHEIIEDMGDAYALLHHELAHILFKTDVRNWTTLYKEFPNVKKEHIGAILNILEDIRIEHAWGKLFPGNYAQFLVIRKRTITEVPTEPIGLLLAVRAGRQDLIAESNIWLQILAKKYVKSIKQIRGNTSHTCLISAREIIHLIAQYWNNIPSKKKKCKCNKCGKDVTLSNKPLQIPKVTWTMNGDVVICDSCKEPGSDGDGCGGDDGNISTPKDKNDDDDDDKKGNNETQDSGDGISRGHADGSGKKAKGNNNPFNEPTEEQMKALEEKESVWDKFNNEMSKVDLKPAQCLGQGNDIVDKEYNIPECLRGQNQKELSNNLAKTLSKQLVSDERKSFDRRMNVVKKKIQKAFVNDQSKTQEIKNILEENLQNDDGYQETIPEHEWTFGEWTEPRKEFIRNIKSMVDDSNYSRRYDYKKSGSKINISRAINYIASGQNEAKRNFFKKRKLTGKKLSICYVVDMSSSMHGHDERIAREIMLTTDYALRNINAITSDYVVFESNVRARIENTRLLHQVSAQGGTYATPAIKFGANILNHEHEGMEKVLIFLSDGGHESTEEAFNYCVERNIIPLIIAVNPNTSYGQYGKYADNLIVANDYDKAFEVIMKEIFGRVKKILEDRR